MNAGWRIVGFAVLTFAVALGVALLSKALTSLARRDAPKMAMTAPATMRPQRVRLNVFVRHIGGRP